MPALMNDGKHLDNVILFDKVDRIGESSAQRAPDRFVYFRIHLRIFLDCLQCAVYFSHKDMSQTFTSVLVPREGFLNICFRFLA